MRPSISCFAKYCCGLHAQTSELGHSAPRQGRLCGKRPLGWGCSCICRSRCCRLRCLIVGQITSDTSFKDVKRGTFLGAPGFAAPFSAGGALALGAAFFGAASVGAASASPFFFFFFCCAFATHTLDATWVSRSLSRVTCCGGSGSTPPAAVKSPFAFSRACTCQTPSVMISRSIKGHVSVSLTAVSISALSAFWPFRVFTCHRTPWQRS